jgi:hypothetical protein
MSLVAQVLRAKFVEVVMLGDPIAPDLAWEVIRRTDLVFRRLTRTPVAPADRALRDRLGFPGDAAPVRTVQRWRRRWGSIDLQWLGNNRILHGDGWCHPDGSIALAGELEDYPRADEVLQDCRRIARAFPTLVIDVALWGSGPSILGKPLCDAPDTPWPARMWRDAPVPSIGFLLAGGAVRVVAGTDPRLFGRLGLTPGQAAEAALRGHRLGFHRPGPQGGAAEVPPRIAGHWAVLARDLGLATIG